MIIIVIFHLDTKIRQFHIQECDQEFILKSIIPFLLHTDKKQTIFLTLIGLKSVAICREAIDAYRT